jgi:Leucine-rich repeat (LRR) protein
LPVSLGGLPSLEEFAAEDNQLTAIPDTFAELHRLKLLKLAGNGLKSVPEGVFTKTPVASVDLARNPMTDSEVLRLPGYEVYLERRKGKVNQLM